MSDFINLQNQINDLHRRMNDLRTTCLNANGKQIRLHKIYKINWKLQTLALKNWKNESPSWKKIRSRIIKYCKLNFLRYDVLFSNAN